MLPEIKISIKTFDLINKFGKNGKRAFNRAVADGMRAKVGDVQEELRKRAPKDSGELSRSLIVEVKSGAGGAAKFLRMVPNIKGGEAEKYWLVREFGPRGGVIKGKKKMSFAFKGSPMFGKGKSASDVARNPGAFGFDYTMISGKLIFGVKRKTGLTWEQLYPNAKKRKKARIRRGKGLPTTGNPNLVPLFVLVDAVHQTASPYLVPTFEAMAAEVQQSIIDHVMGVLNG